MYAFFSFKDYQELRQNIANSINNDVNADIEMPLENRIDDPNKVNTI